jgi:hypothetical protein
MQLLKVVTIGFPYGSFEPHDGVLYCSINDYTSIPDESVSGRELYARLIGITQNADYVLLCMDTKKTLALYEVVLLTLAYSNRTPIIGVGEKYIEDNLLDEFVCNNVDDVTMAVVYLENFCI